MDVDWRLYRGAVRPVYLVQGNTHIARPPDLMNRTSYLANLG